MPYSDSSGARAVLAYSAEKSTGKRKQNNATPTSKPSTSRTSYAVMVGYNINIFGDGLQVTLNFVSTKKNFGLQYSYYYSKDSELSKKNNNMIGIDIEKVERFKDFNKTKLARIFTKQEIDYCYSFSLLKLLT